MNRHEIQERKQKIEARYGPWISHNLDLGQGVYSISPEVFGGNEIRLRRVVQLVSDLAAGPIEQLRILDLGAFEGLFAVEFARRGSTVVAVEGREASLEKMRLAKDAHALDKLQLYMADVRDLELELYGTFDVVLCLGLLYHLDAPDVFRLLARMRQLCKGFLILETHTAPSPREQRTYNERSYWGMTVEEPLSSPKHSRDQLWAALDNPSSFHLTEPSLLNALSDAGYSSVLRSLLPSGEERTSHRALYICFATEHKEILSVPAFNREGWRRAIEAPAAVEEKLRRYAFYRWLEPRVVWRLKSVIRRITSD